MDLFEIQDYMDPNLLENGAFQYFSKQAQVELRLMQEDMSEKIIGEEKIHIRVFGQSADKKNLNWFKIELTSDVDIFFTYIKQFDYNTFQQFKFEEQIQVDFEQFPNNLLNIINSSINQQNEKIVFLMEIGKPVGNLVFLQDLGHKNMLLLSMQMDLATQEQVKQNIMYRYSKMNKKLIDRTNKLEQINDYIKIKNPELLNILQKNLNIPQPNNSQNGNRVAQQVIKKIPFH
ncbi:hypothetical protein ABPG72_009199 [Tetrahymena utriculariae]